MVGAHFWCACLASDAVFLRAHSFTHPLLSGHDVLACRSCPSVPHAALLSALLFRLLRHHALHRAILMQLLQQCNCRVACFASVQCFRLGISRELSWHEFCQVRLLQQCCACCGSAAIKHCLPGDGVCHLGNSIESFQSFLTARNRCCSIVVLEA